MQDFVNSEVIYKIYDKNYFRIKIACRSDDFGILIQFLVDNLVDF